MRRRACRRRRKRRGMRSTDTCMRFATESPCFYRPPPPFGSNVNTTDLASRLVRLVQPGFSVYITALYPVLPVVAKPTASPALGTSSGSSNQPCPVSPSTKLEPSGGQVSETSSSSRSSSSTLGSVPEDPGSSDTATYSAIQSSSTPRDTSSESIPLPEISPDLQSPQTTVSSDTVKSSTGISSSNSTVSLSKASISVTPRGTIDSASGTITAETSVGSSYTSPISCPQVTSTSSNTITEDISCDIKIPNNTLTTQSTDITNSKPKTSCFGSNINTSTCSASSTHKPGHQTSPHQDFTASLSSAGVGAVPSLGAGLPYPAVHARAAVSGRSLRSRALLSRGSSYAVRKMSVAGGPGGFHHQGGGDNGSGGGGIVGGGSIDAKDEDAAQEFDMMERWLDEHPEFVHDYFARKAHKSMVDGWLLAHALAGAENLSTSSTSSKASSGANTPVRKISAQDFERGGILNPMVSTVDGLPTFLGPSCSSTPTPSSKCRRRSKSELKALDEKELMYELVIDICNDLDVTSLCYKILQNLCILLNADRCSLFLVKGTSTKYLASKLFDVTSDSEFESVCDREDEIRIPLGTGIAGYVAKTGEVVNIPDAYEVSAALTFFVFVLVDSDDVIIVVVVVLLLLSLYVEATTTSTTTATAIRTVIIHAETKVRRD
ncbi:phosphodiesterase [Elysia marginata]|uniref:Phosphodiesterase n=1 Tax=Elysia marginata TaxID=1093978 RepID=A0AAV4EXM3_9GAST|nr:phosphodiesterase [Elysia marginata]